MGAMILASHFRRLDRPAPAGSSTLLAHRWLTILGVILLSGGVPSQGAGQSAPLPRVLDSAGVRIITHGDVRRVAAPFQLSGTPSVDLGGLRQDPGEELNPRNPFLIARPLSDGRWVVVDFDRLRVFSARGQPIRSLGRPGQGPGEFRQIREVCVTAGDTIVAVGFSDRRVSVFDSAGRHVRTTTISGTFGADPCFEDGSLLVRRMMYAPPDPNMGPFLTAPVERVRWDGSVVGALGVFEMESLDLAFSGTPNIVAGAGRLYAGNGRDPEYRVYGSTGRLERVVRWSAPRVPITSAMRADAVRRRNPVGPIQRPDLPYYSSLHVGPDGSVWLKGYAVSPAVPAGFTIFDVHGGLVGRIELPIELRSGSRLAWIGVDRVLLGWRDEDGAPHLTLHAIVPL